MSDAISVSALVDPTAYQGDSVILDKTQTGDAANYRFGISGTGQLFYWNGKTTVYSKAAVPLNAFSQVGFTLNGATSTLAFYINGQLDSTSSTAFGAVNTAAVFIGRDLSGDYFRGMIADLAVYHGVLTAAQMSLLAVPSAGAQVQAGTVPGVVSIFGVNGSIQDVTGTNSASATSGVSDGPGVVGQALQFNGQNGEISVPNSPSLDTPAFTVGGWFDVSQAPSLGYEYFLASKYDGNDHGWILRLSNSLFPTVSVQSSATASVNVGSSQPLSLNTWYYIAATYDGTTATIYIDGAAVGTATLSGGYTPSATPMVIGAASWYGGGYFDGGIEGFTYDNTSLSAAQVRTLSASGTAELADSYLGQGNAFDSSGTSNGTPTGGVSYAPGLAGQSFSFNGQNSYIALGTGPDIVGTGAFAVAAWVKTTAGGTEYILSQRDPNNFNGEYTLDLVNGQVNFYVYGNGQYDFNMTTSGKVNDGNWHMIVAQRSADGTGQIFIDGTLAATQTGTPVPLGSGFNVYIGEDVRDAVDVGPGYAFNYIGQLEAVQIYDQALTAGQVTLLHSSLASQVAAASDQRGDARRVAGGLDIGADQYQYGLSVTGGAPPSVTLDGFVTYNLTVTNSGADPVGGVTLTDVLPSTVVFDSFSAPSGWSVTNPSLLGSGGTLTATDGSALAPGASVQVSLVGFVSYATEYYSYITNTVRLSPVVGNATPAGGTLSLSSQVANGLGIASQPTSATAGSTIVPPLAVTVVNNDDNTVTTDSTQSVTLAIASGPAGAILSGPTTVVAVNGVATFTGLSVNLPGTYVLVATGGVLTPVDTDPIAVAPVVASISPSPTSPSPTRPIAVTPVVVTGGLSISRKPLHVVKQVRHGRARTEVVQQKVTIKETLRDALSGPLALQVTGLRAGETLSNASGSYGGNPYADVLIGGESLAYKHSATVTLDFSIEGKAPRNLKSIYRNIEAMLGL